MRTRTFYIVILSVVGLIIFLISTELYERNFLREKKLYNAILVEKYINYNTDGYSYMLKFKFNWKVDTIIEEASVDENDYKTYKLNDTVFVYYSPNATTTKIIFANSIDTFNKGSIAAISFLFVLILYLTYKIKTARKDDFFFMDEDR